MHPIMTSLGYRVKQFNKNEGRKVGFVCQSTTALICILYNKLATILTIHNTYPCVKKKFTIEIGGIMAGQRTSDEIQCCCSDIVFTYNHMTTNNSYHKLMNFSVAVLIIFTYNHKTTNNSYHKLQKISPSHTSNKQKYIYIIYHKCNSI